MDEYRLEIDGTTSIYIGQGYGAERIAKDAAQALADTGKHDRITVNRLYSYDGCLHTVPVWTWENPTLPHATVEASFTVLASVPTLLVRQWLDSSDDRGRADRLWSRMEYIIMSQASCDQAAARETLRKIISGFRS